MKQPRNHRRKSASAPTYRTRRTPLMSKAQALAWKARWRAVNQARADELRAMPVDLKLRHASQLMQTAIRLGWMTKADAEIEEVRRRWVKLKKHYAAASRHGSRC